MLKRVSEAFGRHTLAVFGMHHVDDSVVKRFKMSNGCQETGRGRHFSKRPGPQCAWHTWLSYDTICSWLRSQFNITWRSGQIRASSQSPSNCGRRRRCPSLVDKFLRFGLPSLSQAPCSPFLVIFFAVRATMSLLSPPDSSSHWLLRRPFLVTADARAPTCCLEPASQTLTGSPLFSFRPFLVTADVRDPTPVLEPASPLKLFLDPCTSSSSRPRHSGRRRTCSDLLRSLPTPGTLVLSLDSLLVIQALWTSLHQVGHNPRSKLDALPADRFTGSAPFSVPLVSVLRRIPDPRTMLLDTALSCVMMPSTAALLEWYSFGHLTFIFDHLRFTHWNWASLSTMHATRTQPRCWRVVHLCTCPFLFSRWRSRKAKP